MGKILFHNDLRLINSRFKASLFEEIILRVNMTRYYYKIHLNMKLIEKYFKFIKKQTFTELDRLAVVVN